MKFSYHSEPLLELSVINGVRSAEWIEFSYCWLAKINTFEHLLKEIRASHKSSMAMMSANHKQIMANPESPFGTM
jgi:hypothetical protein